MEENKETGLITPGRKRTQKEVEREINRHVTSRTQLQLLEDIPTPEGVQVFTPGAEVSSPSVTLRKVCWDNLPSVQLQKDIQTLVFKDPRIYNFDAFRAFKTSDPSSGQLSMRDNLTSRARSLQKDLENAVNNANSSALQGLPSMKAISLASYFPLDETNNDFMLGSYGLKEFGVKFLQYFICLTNNGTISGSQLHKVFQGIILNLGESFLFDLFSRETTTITTFMRKILPTVVDCGNTSVVKCILKKHSDILKVMDHRLGFYGHTKQEECVSIAVENGDIPMVRLLCTAGFSPRILGRGALFPPKKLPWDTGRLETLQTLLSFGAQPECFIVGKPRGYPLIDAAKSGRLDAVNILLKYGSRIDSYAIDYFGTALQAAVWAGQVEMVDFLIACGADINAPCGTQYQSPESNIPRYKHNEGAFWSMMTPIQIACAKDNVPLVILLLNRGADVNLSPLSQVDLSANKWRYIFCHYHPVDIFESTEYSPLYDEWQYLTALQHSIRNGNTYLVQLLLLSKANPNLRATSHQWEDTPLQLSIRLDHSDIARILIESGAHVNASPGKFNGRTALQAAAESGNIHIAQELLRRDADINAPPADERGLTALQAAIKMGHSLMAGVLCISGANINAPPAPEGGLTAIQAAAETGDLNLVNDLIRLGAHVKNATAGTKAMLASISRKSLPILELLVKCGAPINSQEDDDYMPPIVASVREDWMNGVVYLLDNGADINSYYYDAEEHNNLSSLSWSIITHDIQIIDLLLTRGANLHIPDAEYPYNDSLCLALHLGCPAKICNRLLDQYTETYPFFLHEEVLAEAVCNTYDDEDRVRTARLLSVMSRLPKKLYVAQILNAWDRLSGNHDWLNYLKDGNEKIANQLITLLLRAGVNINSRHPSSCTTLLQRVTKYGRIELAKFLIQEGAEIQVPSCGNTGTPLQEAIRGNETDFTHFLLERGADINAAPSEAWGATALQAAAKNGNRSLVTILIERGAEVNAPPARDSGITALQAAAIEGYIDIAVDLLQHGAHVSAPGASKNGRTAIDGAAEHGHEDMLQLLLNHYDGCENLSIVCERAATYAEKEGHGEIAAWLRQYPNLSTDVE